MQSCLILSNPTQPLPILSNPIQPCHYQEVMEPASCYKENRSLKKYLSQQNVSVNKLRYQKSLYQRSLSTGLDGNGCPAIDPVKPCLSQYQVYRILSNSIQSYQIQSNPILPNPIQTINRSWCQQVATTRTGLLGSIYINKMSLSWCHDASKSPQSWLYQQFVMPASLCQQVSRGTGLHRRKMCLPTTERKNYSEEA